MKTKIEIKSIFGKVLFTYEDENATIKEAVEKAIEEKADLSYSNLSYSDLSYSNLKNSNLRGSNLRGSNLSYSNLSYSNLKNSNLSYSDLRGSKNKETAYIPLNCKWSFTILGDKIQIGCKDKTIEEWELFFNSDNEFETNRNTEEFKQIQACYEACKAYLTFLNK